MLPLGIAIGVSVQAIGPVAHNSWMTQLARDVVLNAIQAITNAILAEVETETKGTSVTHVMAMV